jgi:hypothetical protein
MKSKLSAALAAAGRALHLKDACLLGLVPALILPMSASYGGTFTFTESNSTIIASGQLTTAGPFQLGHAPVTSVSATFDGFPITGLLPPRPLIFIFEDNILFDRPPFVDIFVILFSTANKLNQWRTFSTTEPMRSPVVPRRALLSPISQLIPSPGLAGPVRPVCVSYWGSPSPNIEK